MPAILLRCNEAYLGVFLVMCMEIKLRETRPSYFHFFRIVEKFHLTNSQEFNQFLNPKDVVRNCGDVFNFLSS